MHIPQFPLTLFTTSPQPNTSQQTDQWPTDVFPATLHCVPYPEGKTEARKIVSRNSRATTAKQIWIVQVVSNFSDTRGTIAERSILSHNCFATFARHFWICWAPVSDTVLGNNVSWSGLGLSNESHVIWGFETKFETHLNRVLTATVEPKWN